MAQIGRRFVVFMTFSGRPAAMLWLLSRPPTKRIQRYFSSDGVRVLSAKRLSVVIHAWRESSTGQLNPVIRYVLVDSDAGKRIPFTDRYQLLRALSVRLDTLDAKDIDEA